jgi:hemerythrin-like domain-containing protein
MTHVDMRRRWLIGVAGLVLATPALADPRRQAAPKKKTAEGTTIPATERLMRNNGVLLRVLLIYEAGIRRLGQGEDIDPAVFIQAAETMRDFIHDYHEKTEEDHVFPRFKASGRMVELVNVLIAQHGVGKQLTDRVLKAAPGSSSKDQRIAMIEAMQASITLYRPHVARETTDALPTLRSLVTPNEFDELGEALAKEENAKFGADGFEKMAKKVEELEKRIGIHDLAQFTPKT